MKKTCTIDVIGRACRLPGANSVDAFKQLLFEERCSISQVPDERWAKWRLLHPQPGIQGKSYTFAAGVLDDIWGFDPKVFGISPREASQMDPQQRILLQLVWEALEDAGMPPADLAGEHVGVYVGASSLDYGNRLMFDPNVADAYMMTGNTLSLVSNRISYVYDLRGPSMTIDTACSSSLIALNEAMRALQSGEIDTAVVAGVNVLLNPASFVGFSAARMLSQTGLCQSFSANADGYVRAEGGIVLVLRRQDAAAASRTRVHGRIVDIATNTDGRTIGVALPSSQGQAELLTQLYEKAQFDPNKLSFVEAHGTGTLAGDPIEAEAIGQALGRRRSQPLPIGSVKSNIGHLEPAAGLAGLLKSLIAMEAGQIPASLHADEPNPHIPFDKLNLQLVTKPQKLPVCDDEYFAGVSSFGFGGTNAHVIVAARREALEDSAPSAVGAKARSNRIFFTSAFCKDSLRQLTWRYSAKMADHDNAATARLCNEAIYHRGSYPHRVAIMGDSHTALRNHLKAFFANEKNPQVFNAHSALQDVAPVFVYSGNGAQFAGMSLAGLAANKAYAKHYKAIDERFKTRAGWSLIEALSDDDLPQKLNQADVAQPLLFADQVALTRALDDQGLRPAAVFGHSGGEVAAAHCSGALDLDQALMIIHERSKSQRPLAGRGTMAALQLSEEETLEALEQFGVSQISVAAVNSPRSISLSGPVDEINEFIRWARREKRWACLKLKINYPYHSPIQDEIEDDLRAGLKGLKPVETDIPFISSVTGQITDGRKLDVDYWWNNVRQAVRFIDAVKTAHDQGWKFFLECSPQPVLASYLNDSLSDHGGAHVTTHTLEKADTPEVDPIRRAFCRAFVYGAKIDLKKTFGAPQVPELRLPHYPWQNEAYRSDLSENLKLQFTTKENPHPLLGREFESEAHCWVSHMDSHMLPELAQHVVGGQALMPGAAFIEMALAAAQKALDTKDVELRDLDIIAPLPLQESQISEARTQIWPDSLSAKITSRQRLSEDDWREHVSCRIGKLPQSTPVLAAPPRLSRLPEDQDARLLYEVAEEIGLSYGPLFQQASHFRQIDERVIEVVLKPEETAFHHQKAFGLDPIALDAVFHGLLACLIDQRAAGNSAGFVPVHVARVRCYQPGQAIVSGRIKIKKIGSLSMTADMLCFAEDGQVGAVLEGVRFRAVNLKRQIDFSTHAYGFALQPLVVFQPTPEAAASVSLGRIEQQFLDTAQQARFEPEDESYLLVEAIAQKIAYDLVCQFIDDKGHFQMPQFTAENEELSRQKQTYLYGLLNVIARADPAKEGPNGWVVNAQSRLPSSKLLMSGMLAEKPERVAECALLGRLRRALPDLFADRLDWDLASVFGRNALEGFTSGSALTRRRVGLLEAGLEKVISVMPDQRALTIAEIAAPWGLALDQRSLASLAHGARVFQLNPTGQQGRWSASSPSKNPHLDTIELSVDALSKAPAIDLLIISGGLHRLGNLQAILPALRKKMASHGVLISLEDAPDSFHDVVFGLDKDWYHQGATPEFPVGPLRGEQEWSDVLSAAGFKNIEVNELPDGFAAMNLIIAGAPENNASSDAAKADPIASSLLELEAQQSSAPSGLFFIDALQSLLRLDSTLEPSDWGVESNPAAHSWRFQMLGTGPQHEQDATDQTIFFLPCVEGGPSSQELIEQRVAELSAFLVSSGEKPADLWIILPQAANYSGALDVDPAQAAIWAFLRTAANEFPNLTIRCVDPTLQQDEAECAQAFMRLWKEAPAETEIVLGAHDYGALRVYQGEKAQAGKSTPDHIGDSYSSRLSFPTAGKLDDLGWHLHKRRPPDANEVEIEVEATGLNYRDVMWALGMLPEEALENGFAGPTLGLECAGRIVQTGSNVDDLNVGDPVVAFGPACFSSHLTVDRNVAAKLPEGLDLAAAASLPVAFFTAYYSLKHLGNLQKNETVLIHGGAGGVGLAAIQIAQWRGARVIATAGSDVKRDLLHSFEVDHVLDSRSLEFADDIMQLTDGRGVDVVLNSLAGEAMELSLNTLRPFGRFLELGKRDFYANSKMGMRALKENISYFGIDADQLLAARPDLTRELFEEMMQLFAAGEFTPLPYREFTPNTVVDAFRLMQRSGHIGKIIVKPHPPSADLPMEDPAPFAADGHGAHIIVGGLGGFGLATMRWLVRHGAKSVVLMGRSEQPHAQALEEIEQLKSRGIEIDYVRCDVSDSEALDAALKNIRQRLPIKGLIHAAMVLEDTQIKTLDAEVVSQTLASKVKGSENLDRLTREDELDYFVLFSSIATLIGNHGQAAYVTANGFLEGLARKRHAQGLPALAIGWGGITDAGYLTQRQDKAAVVSKLTGDVEFTAAQALNALARLLRPAVRQSGNPVTAISPMTWSAAVNVLGLLKGPTYSVLDKLGQQSSGGGTFGDLRADLMQLAPAEREKKLVEFISQEISRILRIPGNELDAGRPVAEFGMDSLMGVEFGLAAQQALGDDIPLMSISEELSINDIAAKIAGHLGNKGMADDAGDVVLDNLAAQHLADGDDVADQASIAAEIQRRESEIGKVIH